MKDGAFVVLLRPAKNGHEVFLVKRSDRIYWELTGGGIEPGEDPVQAARREVSEESGFSITYLSGLVALYSNHREDVQNQSLLFYGTVASGSVYVPEFENNLGAWFPTTELPLVRPITVVRIQDVQRYLAGGKSITRKLARN